MFHLATGPLWAMVNAFAALGAVASVPITRQPEFFAHWGLDSVDWGWVLFAAGLGGVLAYPLNRRLLVRWGSRPMLFRFGSAGGLLLALIPWLPGLAGLLAGMFLQGVICSGAGVATNHQAAQWELRQGRRVMGRLHATFFVGSVLSALASSALAALGVGLEIHMAAAGLLFAWLYRGAARSLGAVPAPEAASPAVPAVRGGLALGLLFGWCTVLESGVMGWASVYLSQALRASDGLAGMGLAVFSCAMALGRLFCDRIVTRFGPAGTVRAGAACCALALALAASLPGLPSAFFAFAATGLGLAAAAPAIFSAAGRVSGEVLALVAGMGASGGLLGPLLLGRVAGLWSLEAVLAALAVVAVVVACQAGALAGDKPGAGGLTPVTP